MEIGRKIIERLDRRKINLHIVSNILPCYKETNIYSINPRDHHPTAEANEMVSEYIIDEILECNTER